jgi:hypothetical protein
MADERVPALLVPEQPDTIDDNVFSILERPRKPARSTKPARERKPKEKKYTLTDAFTCEQNSGETTLDMQKALYSVSFLLQYFSEMGNKDPEGMLIHGLTFALDKIARDVGDLFVWDDILRLGGDPRVIKKQREE